MYISARFLLSYFLKEVAEHRRRNIRKTQQMTSVELMHYMQAILPVYSFSKRNIQCWTIMFYCNIHLNSLFT